MIAHEVRYGKIFIEGKWSIIICTITPNTIFQILHFILAKTISINSLNAMKNSTIVYNSAHRRKCIWSAKIDRIKNETTHEPLQTIAIRSVFLVICPYDLTRRSWQINMKANALWVRILLVQSVPFLSVRLSVTIVGCNHLLFSLGLFYSLLFILIYFILCFFSFASIHCYRNRFALYALQLCTIAKI